MTKVLYSGSAAVTIEVDIAFTTTNPLTAAPTWTDVTQYVQGITIRRGRWTETTTRYDPGTATIQFNNSSRIFDPLYSAGTYFGQLVPMKQVRVRATYSAVTYELFRGFVDGFPQGWDPDFPTYSTSTVTCTDGFGYLATVNIYDRYADEVLTDAPAGYWRCGDPGFEMADTSKNGRHGSWSTPAVADSFVGLIASDGSSRRVGTPGFDLTKFVDLPINFANTVGFYYDPSTLTFTGSTTDITLECWIYLQNPSHSYGTVGPITQGGVEYYGWGLEPSASFLFDQDQTGSGIITVSAASNTHLDQKSYQVTVPKAAWFHLVATYVKNGALTVYLNGKVIASGATGRSPNYYGAIGGAVGMWIVNSDETANTDTDFWVDEVAVYPTALSAARVGAHYVAGSTGDKLERAGDRITSVLDYVGWPSTLRTLSSGDSWLDYGPTPGTALDYLQSVNDTEQGRLFIAGDGTVTFFDRTYAIQTAADNTSQATFDDSGSNLKYQALVLDGGQITSVYNSSVVTPQTGIPGTSEDATSIASYGKRQESLSSLHTNQGDARNLASWRVRQFKDPSLNFTQLDFHPKRDPANLFPQALGRMFGDRVTVKRKPQNIGTQISQERVIDGIQHVFTPEDWTTTFYLTEPTDNAAAGGWWVVGDATNGKVGTAKVPY